MASRTLRLLIHGHEANAIAGWSARRLGFFPALAMLGLTLPIGFLCCLDRYSYYLRPLELIPTYGTAWLLLATAVLPFGLLCMLALKALESRAPLHGLRDALALILLSLAAAGMMAAIGHATLLWLRQVGLLPESSLWQGLAAFSLLTTALLTLTRRGNEVLASAQVVAKYGAVLGALPLLSLPFTGWDFVQASQPPVSASTAGSARPRPNILLVTIDTLAASHMSLYGSARRTTPRLDAFARSATTFEHAYANANFTTAGISSILTATRPWTHRALQLPSWPNTDSRSHSLPAILSQGGYRMGYFGTNPFASPIKSGMGSYFERAQGNLIPYFLFCNEWLSAILPYECVAAELPPFSVAARAWNKIIDKLATAPNWHFDPRVVIRPAIQWLGAIDRKKPIFLWVHFFPPHAPYAAPSPWLGEFDHSQTARDESHSEPLVGYLFASTAPRDAQTFEARYDESIQYMDHYVGEFLDQATRLLGDDTVVIITADHGESLEHNYGTHTGPALYESLIHIPLLIKLPFQTLALRSSVAAEQIDIGPTLADLADLTPPASWEGRTLLPAAQPGADATITTEPVFSMNFEENNRQAALTTGSVAVIDGDWKLVHYAGRLHYPNMPALHDELYNLATDPRELTNRVATDPDEATRLRALIDAQLSLHGAAVP